MIEDSRAAGAPRHPEPEEPVRNGAADHEGPAAAVAVVGLAARFPGAANAAALWRNLRDGIESVARCGDEELAAAGADPAELADPRYVRAKGVLAGADLWDAGFFGFTPREAEVTDPQQRVFLECAWEALEDAGCDPRRLPGRAGVWAGAGPPSYLATNVFAERRRFEAVGAMQALLLNDRDFLATRTSFALDLRGPSVTVQTACSTSLVAVHMACQSLLAGECDLALAGGVSISVPLCSGYLYEEGGVMSPDGHCRAFDAAAAGSVEGNGCGVVVLKRLADAVAAGDRIRAVVRGSAINNDGASKVGFTAPSVEGQAEVIAESLMLAGVDPATIGYVEAHGSGTPLGDPIEIAALAQAFRTAAGGDTQLVAGSCAVGSIKTNIGHCNAAAGVAGLIKAVLALRHRTLPPSLHFSTPNPRIDFQASPFYVPVAAAHWPAAAAPRRAGVSSFGLGGTNAHLVLEEAPPAPPPDPPSRQPQLLVLSARTAAALDAAASRLAEHLLPEPAAAASAPPPGQQPESVAADAGAALADLAWTLQTGRRAFEYRRFLVAHSRQEARAGLALPALPGWRGRCEAAGAGRRRPVVFLFPGLGDQYVDMARGLYDAEPVFRRALDLCAARLGPAFAVGPRGEPAGLLEVLFSAAPGAAGGGRQQGGARPAPGSAAPDLRALRRAGDGGSDGGGGAGDGGADADPAAARLARTRFAQPACFAVEYALARLLIAWGIEPQALLGYSVGEYVAACIGGSLTVEEALDLVARRARRIDELPGGAMLAVPLAEAEVRPLLAAAPSGAGGALALAATNGPHFSVVAGPQEEVDGLERHLAGMGTACLRLRTTHAFHSPLMTAAADDVTAAAVAMRPPRIPWISNVTGSWIGPGELADPAYWARHLTGTVRFAEGLGELLAEPERIFVEVGPGATLSTLVKQHPAAAANYVALPTLRRPDEAAGDVEQLLATVGRLWIEGVEIDWARFHAGAERPDRRRLVALPTYPFERQRYWIDPPAAAGRDEASAAAATAAAPAADLADWFWVPAWKRVPLPAPPAATSGGLWLVLAAPGGLGQRLAARLRGVGHEVATVAAGDGFAEAGAGAFTVEPSRGLDYVTLLRQLPAPPARVLHLWGLADGEPSCAAAQAAGLISLTLLAQALASGAGGGGAAGEAPIQLTLVANGLCEVLDGDRVQPAKATVLGALEVVRQELPRVAAVAVDAPLPPPDSAAEERLIDQLLAEACAAPAPPGRSAAAPPSPGPPLPPRRLQPFRLVALRGRQRFVRTYEPLRLAEPSAEPAAHCLARGGTYLVAGADRGAGPALAEHLVRRLDARVGLVMMDAPAPGGQDPDPAAGAAAVTANRQLLALADEAGAGRVLVRRAAAGDGAAIAAVAAEVQARWGALSGAFWSGGVAAGLIQLKTAPDLDAAIEQVAQESEALIAAVSAAAVAVAVESSMQLPGANGDGDAPGAAEGEGKARLSTAAVAWGAAPGLVPPFVLFASTTAAVTGGVGLLEGAATGSYLEALAARHATAAAPRAAAGAPAAPRVFAAHWDPYQWGGWLVSQLGAGTAGLKSADVEASLLASAVAGERSAAALERLLAGPVPAVVVSARDLPGLIAEADSVTADSLLAQLATAPASRVTRPDLPSAYAAPRDELEERLAALWQELFGIEPIGRDDPFLELGGHSLLAIQIVTQARHLLQVDLPLTALFEAPTVAQLAAAVRRARGEADPAEIEALLALVEGLSPEEAAHRLAEMGA